ncbi:MAG: hypothetical protein ACFFCQ_03710 [Promethearchaeota archaeon]
MTLGKFFIPEDRWQISVKMVRTTPDPKTFRSIVSPSFTYHLGEKASQEVLGTFAGIWCYCSFNKMGMEAKRKFSVKSYISRSLNCDAHG